MLGGRGGLAVGSTAAENGGAVGGGPADTEQQPMRGIDGAPGAASNGRRLGLTEVNMAPLAFRGVSPAGARFLGSCVSYERWRAWLSGARLQGGRVSWGPARHDAMAGLAFRGTSPRGACFLGSCAS